MMPSRTTACSMPTWTSCQSLTRPRRLPERCANCWTERLSAATPAGANDANLSLSRNYWKDDLDFPRNIHKQDHAEPTPTNLKRSKMYADCLVTKLATRSRQRRCVCLDSHTSAGFGEWLAVSQKMLPHGWIPFIFLPVIKMWL